MLDKIIKISILSLFLLTFSLNSARCEDYNTNVYKAGVSVIEEIPPMFFGTWRVASSLNETDSPSTFKKKNVDIWNLSKEGDVINLSNPFSGASASITVDYVKQGAIRFTKKNNYDGRVLTDIVELSLDGEKFSGVNTIILETLSDVDNSVIKTAKAIYNLSGEKIAGESIIK